MSVRVGTGCTVHFTESEFEARITSISFGGISRTPNEVTRMAATDRQFWASSNSDSGTFKLEIQFNPDTVPPFWCGTETVNVTWPNLERWTGPMFARKYLAKSPVDGLMTAEIEMKIAGPVQVASLTPLKNDDNDPVYNDEAALVYVGT